VRGEGGGVVRAVECTRHRHLSEQASERDVRDKGSFLGSSPICVAPSTWSGRMN
jgi:hypothetical protein